MPKLPYEIEGLTTNVAGAKLGALAAEVSPEHAIVEVGVYKGKSLAYLASGAQEGVEVIGVDPWDIPRPSKAKYSDTTTRVAAYMNLQGYTNVVLVRDFSTNVARRWAGAGRPKIGLWYLDADHRFDPVLEDFAAWAPHFAPNAAVAFDDCHSDFPGVIKAVQKLESLGRIADVQMLTDRLAVGRFVQ